jgi:hypothetical protein
MAKSKDAPPVIKALRTLPAIHSQLAAFVAQLNGLPPGIEAVEAVRDLAADLAELLPNLRDNVLRPLSEETPPATATQAA